MIKIKFKFIIATGVAILLTIGAVPSLVSAPFQLQTEYTGEQIVLERPIDKLYKQLEADRKIQEEKKAKEEYEAKKAEQLKQEQEKQKQDSLRVPSRGGSNDYLMIEATAYCSGKCCTYGTGITASGKKPVEGQTIAVDNNLIKFGSKFKIEGFGDTIFIAQDTGGDIKGNRIDIYMDNHSDTVKFGRKKLKMYPVN